MGKLLVCLFDLVVVLIFSSVIYLSGFAGGSTWATKKAGEAGVRPFSVDTTDGWRVTFLTDKATVRFERLSPAAD